MTTIVCKVLTPLQQTTLEIIVINGEIAHDEQFLNLPQYFQLCSIIIIPFKEKFYFYAGKCSQSSAADCCMWERVKFYTIEAVLVLVIEGT